MVDIVVPFAAMAHPVAFSRGGSAIAGPSVAILSVAVLARWVVYSRGGSIVAYRVASSRGGSAVAI